MIKRRLCRTGTDVLLRFRRGTLERASTCEVRIASLMVGLRFKTAAKNHQYIYFTPKVPTKLKFNNEMDVICTARRSAHAIIPGLRSTDSSRAPSLDAPPFLGDANLAHPSGSSTPLDRTYKLTISRVGELDRAILVGRQENSDAVPARTCQKNAPRRVHAQSRMHPQNPIDTYTHTAKILHHIAKQLL